MIRRNKFLVIIICLTLVTSSLLIVSAKKPQKPTPANYLELPPIDKPNNPEEGFILYCDNEDGKLKALDINGEETILAIPQPPITYRVGILGWGSSSDNVNPMVLMNVSDNLFEVLSYDETQSLYAIKHPSLPSDWDIIWNIGNMDYNHPDGIYMDGLQDEMLLSLYPEPMLEDNYTIIINVRFEVPRTLDMGIVFNYIDENNFYWGDLTLVNPNSQSLGYFKLWKYEDGAYLDLYPTYYRIPIVYGVTYDLKIQVSNTEQKVDVYINNSLWNYTIDL